jgi:hypothetical protein
MTDPILYTPKRYFEHRDLPKVPTSWNGLERIIWDIMSSFHVDNSLAIEFGTWHGYSAAALAEYFKHVIAIDMFIGDTIPGTMSSMLETTRQTLAPWPNIELWEKKWQQIDSLPRAGLIHIDIEHTYDETYGCGLLCLDYADVIIFHDTESFADVKKAVGDQAEFSGRTFYNFPYHHGLGILVAE